MANISVDTFVHQFRLTPLAQTSLRNLSTEGGVLFSHGYPLAKYVPTAKTFITAAELNPAYISHLSMYAHLSAVHREFKHSPRLPDLSATWEQTLQFYQSRMLATSNPNTKAALTGQLNTAQQYFALVRPPLPQDTNPYLDPTPFALPATMRQTPPRSERCAVPRGRTTAMDTAPTLFAVISQFLAAPQAPTKFGAVFSRVTAGIPTLYYLSTTTPLARRFLDYPRTSNNGLHVLAYHHNPRIQSVLYELRRQSPRHQALPSLSEQSPDAMRIAMNNTMRAIYEELNTRRIKTAHTAVLVDDYHYLLKHNAALQGTTVPIYAAPDPKVLKRFSREGIKAPRRGNGA